MVRIEYIMQILGILKLPCAAVSMFLPIPSANQILFSTIYISPPNQEPQEYCQHLGPVLGQAPTRNFQGTVLWHIIRKFVDESSQSPSSCSIFFLLLS